MEGCEIVSTHPKPTCHCWSPTQGFGKTLQDLEGKPYDTVTAGRPYKNTRINWRHRVEYRQLGGVSLLLFLKMDILFHSILKARSCQYKVRTKRTEGSISAKLFTYLYYYLHSDKCFSKYQPPFLYEKCITGKIGKVTTRMAYGKKNAQKML